jgi:LacI family repressor for deo operon, udp, cdd, tsx, nupC, and nupG
LPGRELQVSRASRTRATAEPDRAGIVDVARLAGVSVATVSRSLRGLPNVAASTRERVLNAAEELEYIASPLAAALVTGRTRSVGVVAAYAGRWFFAEVLRGMEEGLRDFGYDLVLHVLPEGERRQRFFVGLPVRRRVDALAVVGLELTHGELDTLRRLQIPIVCVAESLPGVHSERIDNVAAAATATTHLIGLGHRRIAMIGSHGGPGSVPAARAQGFAAALERAGLNPFAVLDGDFTSRGAADALTGLLTAEPQRPTAVFCQSDEMAFGALHALRQNDLRCPQDMSVIGFDDHELAGMFGLTTVSQPVAEQGVAAARWLIGSLEGRRPDDPAGWSGSGPPQASDTLHSVRLVVRETTGPVD